ncbi:MAG TPA: deoxyribodipyrimidine photo-lyase [Verrucomicrobiales bacterium]|nr:deoxyribodipyrimidine photo-lyase [Verrucomicrobiales bacterium]
MNYRRSIHWFRRDLRVSDNTALLAAAAVSAEVVPVYVLSGWSGTHPWTGAGRQTYLCGCLASLAANLSQLGGRLIVRQGDALEALSQLIKETRADAFFFNRDPDPYGAKVERRIQAWCTERGIAFHPFKDTALHERDEILTAAGSPYRVFTPYSKAWFALPKPRARLRPSRLCTPKDIASLPLPTLAHWKLPVSEGPSSLPEPGERAARKRLRRVLLDIVPSYAERRDQPSGNTTSRLGPDLRWGLLSIRQLFHGVEDLARECGCAAIRRSCRVFQQELAWREFSMQILWHHPEVLRLEFNPQYRGLPWQDRPGDFHRWTEGTTGFPIVDAGMRQLQQSGFVHNRVRMIVAMFLTKDLRVDWRLGERWFIRHLLDGEIASNNGGWQWSAGVGADAAPYFRIQNPWTQTKRHDPEGLYIRQWIPELKDVPSHALWTPPAPGQSAGPRYPKPIVDHAEERQITLDWFKSFRASRNPD